MVGERGFEPPTPWSRTRCSTRLSHSPTTQGNSEELQFTLLTRVTATAAGFQVVLGRSKFQSCPLPGFYGCPLFPSPATAKSNNNSSKNNNKECLVCKAQIDPTKKASTELLRLTRQPTDAGHGTSKIRAAIVPTRRTGVAYHLVDA